MYDLHGEKLRFLVVGVCNTVISYVLFLLLLAVAGPAIKSLANSDLRPLALLGDHYYLGVQWLGWAVMVPVSTTTMKYFAFRSPGHLPSEIVRGYFVYLPAQGISSLILWLAVSIAHLIPQVGQLLAIAVTTVFSYLGLKYFTFRTR